MQTSPAPPLFLLRSLARRMTDWRFHCWYWGDAIGIDGLLEADALGAGRYRGHVIEMLQRWHERCLPNFDDALAPGAAIIQLVMDGELPPAAGERVLGRLEALPSAFGAVPALEPHRPPFRFGVCIDALYHLPAAYAAASLWKSDARLRERALRIAIDGMQALRCKAGWAQWFDPTRRHNNEVAWSRGMGWAVLGLLDLVQRLGLGATGEAADLAAQIMERLAQTQGSDGNWAAVLDHPAADAETSTAAFYVAAALHPAARGLVALPAPVLERAIVACRRAVSAEGTYTGATADVLPSWDIESYEHCPTEPSPWAQGAALRAFAALVREARPAHQ
ncbi:MAG TPA: glycoside hydrolase family 88 protein [Steroidobacteraceae bacterium]|nr:glycoside hydrolase family 88 protein [Steroidobacteraceae bacterium]